MPEDHRAQNVALFLICFAVIAIAFGEWRNWVHLIDFGNMFGGGGVGILTGQKIASVTNKAGGQINVNPQQTGEPQ